jgi:sugar (pentulose or hexulose) kinase
MILSVDCGSTNLKAALFDPALRKLAGHQVPVEYSRRDLVHAEFDADELWRSFSTLLNELLEQAHGSLNDLTDVTMGSQAQTFCLLDERDRPLMPFISWMDVRAAEESVVLANRFGQDFHRHCSFSSPLPALQVSKLFWLKANCPDIWNKTRRLVTVPGFLLRKLAGLNGLDTNHAAMNGLYSLLTGTWRSDLLAFGAIDPAWLPDLQPAGQVSPGRLAFNGRSVEGRRFMLAGNDHTAGALGNGCRPGEVMVTFGTALVAYRRSGNRAGPYHPGGCWGPYPTGGFYELAVENDGCSALDWARGMILPDQPASAFDALADRAAPGSGGVRFRPEKARTPDAWTGAGTSAEMARAVLEGILFRLHALLFKDMGLKEAASVCALGGGSRSDLWMQMAADVLGCTVRRGGGDSLLGAAALAAGRAEALETRSGEEWKPDKSRSGFYQDLIGRFDGI